MISASVVVCTRNRCALLQACLASLDEQTLDRLEVVVVDNGSTDATPAKLDEWRRAAQYRVVANEPVAGLSRSRNRGLETARGDLVLFLDDDAVVPVGWAAAHGPRTRTIGSWGLAGRWY
jgi:glycosyltransferase involved in cell wall biosynthesis